MPSHCPCDCSYSYSIDGKKCTEEEIYEIQGILKYLGKQIMPSERNSYHYNYETKDNPQAEKLAKKLFDKKEEERKKKEEADRKAKIKELKEEQKKINDELQDLNEKN